ncbi:T9SS type B sorting domain-containing protein [Gaetbulibacter aquiaggeris]|uniref:T9SS type B sorting domain-containing protein n=1 Tax=Gaetbulibacter aquiaggeris TaxID=1735373 RepID=A0ABW7MKH3_9FLAO
MSKKFIICFFSLLALSITGFSQNTLIPDPNFEQALIDLGHDSGPLDGMVPTSNISYLTSLDVQAKNISDITGIQDFIGLTQLFCGSNSITTINVSPLIDLQIFWCSNNELSALDVSKNTKLISLVCDNNQLTNLNVTNNPALNVLVFETNQITTIDVSINSTLTTFNCSNNFLTSLDISNNNNLVNLNCSINQISDLDISKNLILITLDLSFNLLEVLDLSLNNQITEVICRDNNLCQINIKNGNNNALNAFDFSNNPNLSCVVVDNPSGNPSSWIPTSFTNYTYSINDCKAFVNVDSQDNFIGATYILPNLTYGSYFTGSGGTGINLSPGDFINTSQTIFIYNETFCDSNETSFRVIITEEPFYIPKYFTPNNDGHHDFWVVKDFLNNIKNIAIFDHYGKLLKSLGPNIGWNGSFNGKPMETNDYWYVITLQTGEVLKGHFTLKR